MLGANKSNKIGSVLEPCGLFGPAVAWTIIWYLIQTRFRDELRAKAHLERQGFDVYCPVDAKGAFFPGYVFLKAGERDYSPIKSTRGVIRIVGQPAPWVVPDSLVEAYKETDWIRRDEFDPGTKILVNDHGGAFAHRTALLKARKGDRAVILIDFLGRQQEAILPLKAVSKC